MAKGKFIVIEGCEGAGKSYQSGRLCDTLNARGIPAIVTREPGGAPLGEKLRALILDPSYAPDAITELYMYSAARRVHLNEVVLPALSGGTNVICDRFIYSTLAYQGYARGVNIDYIRAVNRMTVAPTAVDLALFLDLPPELGFSRKGGADKGDRLERESLEFFGKVYDGFKRMCAGGELVAIDGRGNADEVAALVLEKVLEVL